MNVDAFVFGALKFKIETPSRGISPVMSMTCPPSSLLIDFILKCNLSDIRIATPVCFLGPFDWKTFSQPLTVR